MWVFISLSASLSLFLLSSPQPLFNLSVFLSFFLLHKLSNLLSLEIFPVGHKFCYTPSRKSLRCKPSVIRPQYCFFFSLFQNLFIILLSPYLTFLFLSHSLSTHTQALIIAQETSVHSRHQHQGGVLISESRHKSPVRLWKPTTYKSGSR